MNRIPRFRRRHESDPIGPGPLGSLQKILVEPPGQGAHNVGLGYQRERDDDPEKKKKKKEKRFWVSAKRDTG